MYRSKPLFACLLSAAILPLLAQEGPPAGGRGPAGRGSTRDFLGLGPAPDAAAAARGEKLYAANCGFCHGDKARGAEGPNLVRSDAVLHDEKGELIGAVVSQGRTDKGMPAFAQFSKDQLYDIAEFLHRQVELVANRGIYKRLNVVSGDAKAGEAYFNGAGRCNTCHSPTGDLAHIGSRYQADTLQTRFIWPGPSPYGGGRGGPPPKVTVTLASGEVVSGTLKRQDDFNISIYDAQGDYHSWPRASVKVQVEDKLAGHRELLAKYTDKDMHDLTAYLVTLK